MPSTIKSELLGSESQPSITFKSTINFFLFMEEGKRIGDKNGDRK